jgi:hypothetical protein
MIWVANFKRYYIITCRHYSAVLLVDARNLGWCVSNLDIPLKVK